MKEITIELSTQSITKAIKELKSFSKDINKKTDVLMARLADVGVSAAQNGFNAAQYDGDKGDIQVTRTKAGNGYDIVAEGEKVAFIEFGAGVTYPTDYPGTKPDGIVGIGEYGDGKGKRRTWGFYPNGDKSLPVVLTHGNPANMPMYNASREMENRLPEVAREVFR